MRWVVRPKSILTTPLKLKEVLGARRVVKVKPDRLYSWERDFFLTYPPIEQIKEFQNAGQQPENSTTDVRQLYAELRRFAASNKPEQRQQLGDFGLRVPDTGSYNCRDGHLRLGGADLELDTPLRWIVRPLRHSQGQGYRITSDPEDWNPAEEYIQRLYPKKHEYRVIFFKGHKLVTLIKKVPDGIDPDGPWNHACGSRFVTVTNEENDRLRHTDVYEGLRVCPIIKSAHLVGVDVLLSRKLHPDSPRRDYVITEFNFCPSVTIDTTLERIKHHAAEGSQASRQ